MGSLAFVKLATIWREEYYSDQEPRLVQRTSGVGGKVDPEAGVG